MNNLFLQEIDSLQLYILFLFYIYYREELLLDWDNILLNQL